MDRIDEILRGLEHELVETRNLTIKTDNSVRSLAADIKKIAKRQEDYERRGIVNSVAAYVLFTVVIFVGLLMFFRASLAGAELDHELAAQREQALERRVEELEAEIERRRTAENEAYAFYELLRSDRRDEVVERFPAVQGRLQDRATIELFRREVERIRQELAEEAFRLGMQNAENQQWQNARDALSRSLAYVERPPYAHELHFQLGEALFHLDDYPGAARYYELAINAGALARNEAQIAYFHLAEALERANREREAVEAYRQFARRYGAHSWAPTAEQRIRNLERRLELERRANENAP